MKIVLISGASTIHTVRWANGLSAAGHIVHVISQHPIVEPFSKAVKVHLFPYRGALGYYLMAPGVRKIIKNINPDIVNAHYASGYGTTARLVDFHPYVLSVWGADVYDFPEKGFFYKKLLKKNLVAADQIASTSHCMARQTEKYINPLQPIEITPFGVDISRFDIVDKERKESSVTNLVIGTVKTMAPKYGIDILLNAFALLKSELRKERHPFAELLVLRLVGGGAQLEQLKVLASDLGIAEAVIFVGKVAHSDVPIELAKLDIYVALSRLDSESFGVAIIEAGAAGLPVVVSNVGGLPEVVIQDRTGLVVPKEDPVAAMHAIRRLLDDPELRVTMGKNAINHVSNSYNWDDSVKKMLSLYEAVINRCHD
ncbi:MAG: D-inositol-3-phosphate glycosyltransferase [Kerstersia gyiorum]|uniref:glycosyltransferase n=1 Tax=Kerstersia gyiorum TaxID=206506 RepID=UPI0030CACA66